MVEGEGEVVRFPTEKVVFTLAQKIQLWQQKCRREANAQNENIPYEPSPEDIQKFALELEQETKGCDQHAALAMQSRLMLPDRTGGERKTLGDFKRALLNLTERDQDILLPCNRTRVPPTESRR